MKEAIYKRTGAKVKYWIEKIDVLSVSDAVNKTIELNETDIYHLSDKMKFYMVQGKLKAWDGQNWIRAPLKVYRELSWQNKPVLRWDGESWKIVEVIPEP